MQIECEARVDHRHEYDITTVLCQAPYVYTTSDDGKIKMWKEQDLSLVVETLAVEEPGYSVYHASLSPKAGIIYTCGNDGQLRTWKIQDLQPAQKQPPPNCTDHEIWRVLCDENTGRIYTLDDNGIVKVYDKSNWRCVAELLGMEQLRDIAAVDDCVFTVRDLDVTCIEMTPSANGYRSATRATLLGRAPLCTIPGENPAIAFTSRDGRSIEIRSSDKKRRFEKLCDITGASDKLISALCVDQAPRKRLYSAGWDNKISAWDISGENGTPACAPILLTHVINTMAITSTAIYAGGPHGFLTKIRLT